MITLTLLGIILLSQSSFGINTSSVLFQEVFAYHNNTYRKADYAYQVVNKVYASFKQWFFTIIFCEFTYFENRILKYTQDSEHGYPVMLLDGCPASNKSKVKPKITKHGQTTYIVTSNKLSLDEADFVIDTLVRTGVFKPRSIVVFVISAPVHVNSYFYYSMKNHFQLLWNRKIANSVLILFADKLRVYTYNLFMNEVYEITKKTHINLLLAQQYNNLYGRELRLSVFYKAFLYDNPGPVRCASRLARIVMKELNATCKPFAPRDKKNVGELLENGTATGVTADLIDGYTDLELNSRILKNDYYGYIDTTYPLAQDDLCFLVKKSGKQSTFTTTIQLVSHKFLFIFSFNVVVLISFSLITRRIERKLYNIEDNRSATETMIDLIKCFLRQTVNITFLGPVFKGIVLMIIMYSLIVDCAIDGIITSAITYPRYKPDLNCLSDVFKSNLTLGVHSRDQSLFNKSLSPHYQDILKNRILTCNDVKFKEVIDKRQYQYAILLRKSEAVFISRKTTNIKNNRPLFHLVRECPVPCFIVYGLRYGSPYLPKIDNILAHLNQAGILDYWSRSEEYTLNRNDKSLFYTNDNKQRKPLNIENLKEVFILLFIGFTISTISFALELGVRSLIHLW